MTKEMQSTLERKELKEEYTMTPNDEALVMIGDKMSPILMILETLTMEELMDAKTQI